MTLSRPTPSQGPLASGSPAGSPFGLPTAGGMSLGVSLAVHGVAVASIVLALRQPWTELDEGSPQVVGARMETFDAALFDEPAEAPAFIVPIETDIPPKLEPLPPEVLESLTEWGPSPFADRDELPREQFPPDLDPERILQDPELPRKKVAPAEPVDESPIEPEVAPDAVVEPLVADVAPENVADEPAAPTIVSPRAVPSDCPPPVYPRLAERRGWTGTVVLLIEVAVDGSVSEVTIESSSGYDILDKAAVTAVRGWRYRPGTLGGQAAALVVRKPIRFDA